MKNQIFWIFMILSNVWSATGYNTHHIVMASLWWVLGIAFLFTKDYE